MKRLTTGALFAGALLLSPATAQAALTQAQAQAVLDLLSAFGADAAVIQNVRTTLLGGPAIGVGATRSLGFGPATPPAELRVARGTARVPFTTLTLTNHTSAAATIYSLSVERHGSGSDSALSKVELVDASGIAHAQSTSFDSRHQTILAPTMTLTAGQSITLTVTGDVSASARRGKTAGLSIVAINASTPVSGTLPLVGTLQRVE